MINVRALVGACAASAGIVVGTAVFVPANASAASYGGQCGGGYAVIEQANLIGGTAFLTYSNATGKNCVVTVRDEPGDELFMVARVGRSGDLQSTDVDQGNYTTYAGPVYVSAAHRCIDWYGQIRGDWNWVGQQTAHCG
ncbi:hypothetical protein [Nocardia sp. NBC_00403]|uniref:hypothetical protein n=1 Tax=Nocardia sp. NBC_00403 TaxID=2975990 RepID=UPI002E1FED2D